MNRIIAFFIVLILCTGCARQSYFLPDFEEVHASPYGAFIRLKTDLDVIVTGELLAVEANSVVIGSPELQTIKVIDTLNITDQYIQFAKHKRFGYPVLIALSHGLWLVFTVPINAIITQVANARDRKELRIYNDSFKNLQSFARYPQGIPEGLNMENYVPPPR